MKNLEGREVLVKKSRPEVTPEEIDNLGKMIVPNKGTVHQSPKEDKEWITYM